MHRKTAGYKKQSATPAEGRMYKCDRRRGADRHDRGRYQYRENTELPMYVDAASGNEQDLRQE